MIPIQYRLVLPVALEPNESCASIFYRSAKHNYGDEHAILRILCNNILKENHLKEDPSQPSHPFMFETLASLLCLTEAQLYKATPHRFADIVIPPKHKIEYIEMSFGKVPILNTLVARRHLRPYSRSQFCPQCLSKAAYHRIEWMPFPITVCLEHQCLLINKCLSCNSHVSYQAIVDDCCTTCGSQLSDSHTVNVSANQLGMLCQEALHSWLMKEQFSNSEQFDPLKRFPVKALYCFIDGLQTFLSHSREAQALFQTAYKPSTHEKAIEIEKHSTYDAFHLYTRAFEALIDWPKGFHDFLNTYRKKGEQLKQKQSGATFELGFLYMHWLEERWQDPIFQFVQDAFNEYYRVRYSFLPSTKKAARSIRNSEQGYESIFISINASATELKTSPEIVERLIELNQLTLHEVPHSRFKFLARSEVLDIRQTWLEGISLHEAARTLGLSETTVIDLYKVGVLNAVRGAEIDGSLEWLFTKKSVLDLLHSLQKHIKTEETIKELINLRLAATKLSLINMNAAIVIKLVSEGHLKAFCKAGVQSTHLSKLLFLREDLEIFVSMIMDRNGWVRISYIAQLMHVKPSTVSKWVKKGIISPVSICGSASYFDRDVIQKFAVEHIFTAEAAQLLGIGSDVVQRWVRRGRLKAICGPGEYYLFKLTDIEKLMPGNCLTAPKLADLIGISHTQMYRWIEKGKIKPISGPGVDDFKQFLFTSPTHEELGMLSLQTSENALDSSEMVPTLGISTPMLTSYPTG